MDYYPFISSRAATIFREAQRARVKESSPVRQHWENDDAVPSPGTGRKIRPTRSF
jgi:hypothetical protein